MWSFPFSSSEKWGLPRSESGARLGALELPVLFHGSLQCRVTTCLLKHAGKEHTMISSGVSLTAQCLALADRHRLETRWRWPHVVLWSLALGSWHSHANEALGCWHCRLPRTLFPSGRGSRPDQSPGTSTSHPCPEISVDSKADSLSKDDYLLWKPQAALASLGSSPPFSKLGL